MGAFNMNFLNKFLEQIRLRAEEAEEELNDEIDDSSMDFIEGEDMNSEDDFSDDLDINSDDEEADGEEDLNRQGLIRDIENAYLVYKRKDEDGSFSELWAFKVGDDFRNELKIQNSILSGTDIEDDENVSENNTQQYEIWAVGNLQMIYITGLPN